ncbi:MAG: C10 family peptidase [Bacteroidaceae bacterium]|nr:C10 family peptidase [Bacteroidaceae bacterium]
MNSLKYRALAIITALLCVGAAQAEPLDEEEARQAAIAFFSPSTTAHRLRAKAQQLTLRAPNHDTGFYIFERPEGGVVFVADDDAIGRTVLGYTDQGTYDPEHLPIGLQDWMQQVTVLMDAVHEGKIAETQVVSRAGEKTVPLIQSHWNQGDPYNRLCPMMNDQRCITGCVATAMAQVMYYWHWPQQGNGIATCKDPSTGQPLSVNLSDHKYDWVNMQNDYVPGRFTSAQATAVATLMRDCGYAVDMHYTPTESAAAVSARTMQKYFLYSPLAKDRYAPNYTTDMWHEYIQEDLLEGRPVLYSGQSTTSGHEFILDGFNKAGFYHVNWGWGGYQDGWFTLTNLYGYNADQWMINHLEPDYAGGETPVPFTYSVNEEGTLQIYGKGMMPEEYAMETAPWRELCSEIKKIVIGEGITSIVDNFGCAWADEHSYEFEKLEEVVLPEGLQNIGWGAFYFASKLASVHLPSTVGIMDDAFRGCGITSLHLPKSLDEYTDYLPNLAKISVDEANPKLTVVDNILYDKDCKVIYMIPPMTDHITIAETTEAILDSELFELGVPILSKATTAPSLPKSLVEEPQYYINNFGYLFFPYDSKGYDSWKKLLPEGWKVLAYTDINRIPEDPSVLFLHTEEPLATCYPYDGESTTVNTLEEWEALLKQYPNAVAVVNPKREQWAYFTRNMLIQDAEADGGYRCPYFRLTDFASSYSNASKAATTGFAPPVPFTITRGFYTRNFREGYNTVCMPFAVSEEALPEGCRMYAYSTFDRDKHDVLFTRQTATEAGHVCFVTCETNVAWHQDLSGTTITLVQPSTQDAHVRGTFVTTDAYQSIGYNPRTNDNIFAPLEKNLHPFRACFLIDEPAATQLFVRLVEDADGIKSMCDGRCTMEDGRCTMDHEELYTLDGKRLAAPLKGQPFIKNGKIVIR